ncbi:MAG TPA: glycosyltransferase [Actinomycetota bacterium]|jgi:GT2 family glycosyltransferase|nr:glycosyltransferase [Actinomycetota bacterium]
MPTPTVQFVTVAVATRNRQDTIEECLESLLVQDLPADRYEVIVVDDDSADRTSDIVRRFVQDTAPVVRYVHQSYGGLAVARNRAITDGRGDLICFLDDDAVATPGWLAAMAAAADRNPDVDCFGGRLLLRLEGPAPRTCGAESLGATLDLGDSEQTIERVKGSNMAMRRSAFERIGLFNPALVWRGDEDNWLFRLHEDGGRVLYIPDALVWHRRTESDLRLRNLLKTRFGWGVGQVKYKRETDVPFRPRVELRNLRRDLAHAVRNRCTGGLLHAAVRIGALWGGFTGELRKPRQSVPGLAQSQDAQ